MRQKLQSKMSVREACISSDFWERESKPEIRTAHTFPKRRGVEINTSDGQVVQLFFFMMAGRIVAQSWR